MIAYVYIDLIKDKLFLEKQNVPHQFNTNREYVTELLINWIKELFPNLNKVQIEAFIINLFNNYSDWSLFKSTVRDLLISMKSFSSTNDEFYQEEKKVR